MVAHCYTCTCGGDSVENYTAAVWPSWNSSITTGSNCAVTVNYPWVEWQAAWEPTTQAATIDSSNGPVITFTGGAIWTAWNESGYFIAQQPMATPATPMTPEEIAGEERKHEARLQRQLAALSRAEELLKMCLDAQQLRDFEEKRYFDVVAPKSQQRYRINRGTHGNVIQLAKNGTVLSKWCGQPSGVPECDSMLSQKLMIETDEAMFRRIANETRFTGAAA